MAIPNSVTLTKEVLYEAFSYYAFSSLGNQPYDEKELQDEFDKWFNNKFQKQNK